MKSSILMISLILLGSLAYALVNFIPISSSSDDFAWGVAWINSPNANGVDFDKGYSLANSIGASMEHRQYLWGEIEVTKGLYNWAILDHWVYSLSTRKISASLAIGPINSDRLIMPYDIRKLSLDDPVVIDRYVEFIKQLLSRYQLSYIAFSNEANFYYRDHPERNPQEYFTFSKTVYSRLQNVLGDVKVLGIFGLTLIYEGQEIDDAFSVDFTSMLAGTYDIFGLSTYDGILGRPSLSLVESKMDFYLSLSSTPKWGIVETGVSTFDSQDLDYQYEYLRFLINYGRQTKDFLFLYWLNLFDYPPGFLDVEKFAHTGLFWLNGTPKPVVETFGKGMYYSYGEQQLLFTNIFFLTFSLELLLLTVVIHFIHRRKNIHDLE